MAQKPNQLLTISDWVTGTSVNDERFLGYIEKIHHESENVNVRIIESDHQKAVGQLINSHINRLKKLDNTPLQEPGQILNLIDIALTNRDQAWFMELTAKLQEIQQKKKSQISLPTVLPKHRWNNIESNS